MFNIFLKWVIKKQSNQLGKSKPGMRIMYMVTQQTNIGLVKKKKINCGLIGA